MKKKRLILSVDLDEWFFIRWITGSRNSRWSNVAEFLKDFYHSSRPPGDIYQPTLELLDLFRRYNIKTTFFVLGQIANWYPDLVEKISREGDHHVPGVQAVCRP